jgi:uncharacterized protein (DUF2235 family)
VKRLLVFLDGTWNRPDDNTNVWRARLVASDRDHEGHAQEAYYEEGVGTKAFEKIRGGALGTGLELNIRNAYQWLMSRYDDGDEIFLFGFSRGAYTARSLAGLINKCGLLQPGSTFSIPEIFERYKKGDAVLPLYKLRFEDPSELTSDDRLLLRETRQIEIEFIGVWDTVGALGIPVGNFPLQAVRKRAAAPYLFHTPYPSRQYRHMYQALAIDENREPFKPAMWTFYQPNHEQERTLKADQTIEQRWFAGVHCNVGGGYRNDALAQIPLAWLLEKASDAGMAIRRPIELQGDEASAKARDSYADFLGGFNRVDPFSHRYWRPIGRPPTPIENTDAWSVSLNETIDKSVFDRWRLLGSAYRPENLVEWSARAGVDPADIHTDWPIPRVLPEGYEPPR